MADVFAAGPVISGMSVCEIDLTGVARNSHLPLGQHMAAATRVISDAGPKWHHLQRVLLEAEHLTGDEVRKVLR